MLDYMPVEIELMDDWKRAILEFRPGITGIWRIAGRAKTSFKRLLRPNVYCISNWSL